MSAERRGAAVAALGAMLFGVGLGMTIAGPAGITVIGALLMAGGLVTLVAALAIVPGRPAGVAAESAGWQEFRRELRRARRHVRPLTIVRIPRPITSEPSADAAAEVRALGLTLRLTDRWWSDETNVFLVLPESDRSGSLPVLDRLDAVRPGARASARVASFPEDGLTSGALIAAILDPSAHGAPTPMRPAIDSPALDEEMAMGEARV